MSDYAIIVQNDESAWDDIKGDLYHYPSTYRAILTPGCKIICYKGRMTNEAYCGCQAAIGVGLTDRSRQRKDRFRSRSGRRFPCGTTNFGIITEYFGAGFGGDRGGASRNGDGRLGVTAARDGGTVSGEGM